MASALAASTSANSHPSSSSCGLDHHQEMVESLGNPYGPNGRAALAMMKLAPG
jgi:hypothetical protein